MEFGGTHDLETHGGGRGARVWWSAGTSLQLRTFLLNLRDTLQKGGEGRTSSRKSGRRNSASRASSTAGRSRRSCRRNLKLASGSRSSVGKNNKRTVKEGEYETLAFDCIATWWGTCLTTRITRRRVVGSSWSWGIHIQKTHTNGSEERPKTCEGVACGKCYIIIKETNMWIL